MHVTAIEEITRVKKYAKKSNFDNRKYETLEKKQVFIFSIYVY